MRSASRSAAARAEPLLDELAHRARAAPHRPQRLGEHARAARRAAAPRPTPARVGSAAAPRPSRPRRTRAARGALRRGRARARSISASSAGLARTVFGPRSTRYSPQRTVSAGPPARAPASSTSRSSQPFAASSVAQARPAIPAPTTTVPAPLTRRLPGRCSRTSRPPRSASTAARRGPGSRCGRAPCGRRARARAPSGRFRAAVRAAPSGRGCPAATTRWPTRAAASPRSAAPVERDDVGAEVGDVVEQVRRAAREHDHRRAVGPEQT